MHRVKWIVLFVLLMCGIAYQMSQRPTADQLYGCTPAQADAATGECK